MEQKVFPIDIAIEHLTQEQLAIINWPIVPVGEIDPGDINKLIGINIRVLVYQLGVTFCSGVFCFFNDWQDSGPLTIDQAYEYVQTYEERFKNEVWFQRGNVLRNWAFIQRGLQSQARGSGAHVSVRPDDHE